MSTIQNSYGLSCELQVHGQMDNIGPPGMSQSMLSPKENDIPPLLNIRRRGSKIVSVLRALTNNSSELSYTLELSSALSSRFLPISLRL